MGGRGYDLRSAAMDRPDRKHCSSISNRRIAIMVAVVLLAGAVIAGIVVAIYFTTIPASQDKSNEIKRIEVFQVKTFQGEVRIEQDWNENLKDLNSNISKEKANNFTSAMDAVYRTNSEYNGTVVYGFKNGSIIVMYRIFWVVTVIREIGKQEQIIKEVEINPVNATKLTELIKNNLHQTIGANVTQITELQELATTTASPNGTTAATETPANTSTTTSITLQPRTSTATTTIIISEHATTTTTIKEPTTRTTTLSTLQSTVTTTKTTPKSNASTPELGKTTGTMNTTPEASTIANTLTSVMSTLPSTLQTKISITDTTNTPEPHFTTLPTTMKSTMTETTNPDKTNATKISTPMTSTSNKPMTTPNPCKLSAGTLACQFEDSCLCGYRNLRTDSKWYQRTDHFFKLPQYDHTYGNETGQFMAAYNNSDMFNYYNDMNATNIGYPHRLEYSNSTLISPGENLTTESCVFFYYYLNGTAVRPSPLSAQLYVYINSSSGIKLAWYDSINRTVNGWLRGWVSVQPGYAEVIFVAKTVTTTTVWPGVVALDDISVVKSPCPSNPDCSLDTFKCMTTGVCIPVYMQCDGGNDCLDGSDEENCTSKEDYEVKLINGDGSYGNIAIFYQGLWRPVCMSKYSLMAGNSTVVQLACNYLGYNGKYKGGFVNSWHQPVQYAMQVTCSPNDVDISNCSMNLTKTGENTSSCYYYQAAICSNEDCFSGETLCPPYYNYSSSTKCISYQYFCDGIIDCPGGTDELNCANCSRSEFECNSHECISKSQQCDGRPQCGDKSDEYGCVVDAKNMSKIYHSNLSAYLPVCYINMNDTLADRLCSLSGQGSSRHYEPYTYVQEGTVLIPQLNVTMPSLVPGYTVSIASCNSTLLQCTSIACGSTLFDDEKLQKILHGRDAVLGQLPWQIALYGDGFFFCGGSIIHPHWVLTAAHCIDRTRSYSITAGAVDVEMSRSEDIQGQWYNSSQTFVHPMYNNDLDNDISLVYIDEPIVYNNYVRPICIASRETVEEILDAGYNAECYVSGWGRYQNHVNGVTGMWLGKLQVIRVYLYDKEDCNQVYYSIFKSYPQSTTVCVDNQNFGAPTCNGDSGGPLLCRNKYGRFEVLGTLSWGYNSCFKDGYPDIYQLSYPHKNWIEDATGLKLSYLTMEMD